MTYLGQATNTAAQSQSPIVDFKNGVHQIYTKYSMHYYRHPFNFFKIMIDEEEDQNAINRFLSNFPQHLYKLTDQQGDTLLLYACRKGKEIVANFLIENKLSPPENVNSDGSTALIYACQHKMLSTVLLLLKTGESRPEWTNPTTHEHAYSIANTNGWTELCRTIKALARIATELPVQ